MMIEWTPVPRQDLSKFSSYDVDKLSRDDVFALYKTLQNEYQATRKRNMELARKLNKTFRHHPINRRGHGWVYHFCKAECFRKTYSTMVHRFESGEDD